VLPAQTNKMLARLTPHRLPSSVSGGLSQERTTVLRKAVLGNLTGVDAPGSSDDLSFACDTYSRQKTATAGGSILIRARLGCKSPVTCAIGAFAGGILGAIGGGKFADMLPDIHYKWEDDPYRSYLKHATGVEPPPPPWWHLDAWTLEL